MVATKTPRKTSTPAAAKSAGRVKTPTETAPVVLPVSEKVVEEAALPVSEAVVNEAPVSEAVEPPQPEAAPEPVVAAVAEPALIPDPVVAVVAAEPEPAPEPEEPEDAGIAVDEDVEQLASLTEQVIYEAEAIAGEAAHNFQVAFKAVTDAQSVVPALSGINTYLHRSVRINAQFVEEFAGVRSPVDLVNLQVRFLEEHRLAMLEFTQSWTSGKSAA